MPFNTSLIEHNPRLADLFDCIDSADREHELFARRIRNNIEINTQLYTPKAEITKFENVDDLIQTYNARLYVRHHRRRLESYKGHIYIKEFEEDTLQIIKRLIELSSKGVKNYTSSVDSWLKSSAYKIDSPEKLEALRQVFEKSEVALIYGSAGTGKSTLINHISNFFHDRKKLYRYTTCNGCGRVLWRI